MNRFRLLNVLLIILSIPTFAQTGADNQYRPSIHFSPGQGWVSDPNSMVYADGQYHLFYQFRAGNVAAGAGHWAHVTSRDLIHWQGQPTDLTPDSLSYVFWGSTMVDINNTTGFDTTGKPPLVAFYTKRTTRDAGKSEKINETQNLAYSIDGGAQWLNFPGNPILKNLGSTGLRDPKVIWYEGGKKWIMTLAATDHIELYSSTNLKTWKKESTFGKVAGAQGGVWTSPDLFPLEYNGKQVWVLLITVSDGGPAGGSGTQYFTGTFDGHAFTANDAAVKWIDQGADNYAGATANNTGVRRIYQGWMSNRDYATEVPAENWHSVKTIPRELGLTQSGGRYFVTSMPVAELGKSLLQQRIDTTIVTDVMPAGTSLQYQPPNNAYRLDVTMSLLQDCSISFTNAAGEALVVGYNKGADQFFIDRSGAGRSDFHKGFAARHTTPRLSKDPQSHFTILIDQASVEFFADGGLTSMTDIFFPRSLLNIIRVNNGGAEAVSTVQLRAVAPAY